MNFLSSLLVENLVENLELRPLTPLKSWMKVPLSGDQDPDFLIE